MVGKQIVRLALIAGLALAGADAAIGADTAASSVPSAENFGALPFISRPLLSPNGLQLVARSQVAGQPKIAVIDFPSGTKIKRLISIPERNQIEWYRWAGDNVVLISVSMKTVFMGQDVRATRLVAFDVATGASRLLGGTEQGIDGDDLVYTDPAGQFILLSTQASIYDYPSVFRIDLATGKRKEIVAAHDYVWDWYADQQGNVRAGVGRDGKKWWVLYRKDGSQDFSKTIRRTFGAGDGQVDNFVIPLGSDQGYAMASGKSGRFGLYRYDFVADKLGELIYENAKVDIDDFDLDTSGKVASVSYTDDRARILWFDPDLKVVQAGIEKAVPGLSVSIVSMSADREVMLVFIGSARSPGAYYVYDRMAGRMKMLAQPYNQMTGKTLSDMESTSYAARDGLEIPAYLTLPAGRAAKNLPLVMMPHGGPFARDAWGYDVWAQFLASRGYVVLQPNFRGSTGYGKEFVTKGYGQWGRGMQDDIDDGVKWLVGRGIVDPKRVCIMGASFGGYAAEWAAVRNPEIYRCAISFAGVSDIAAMLKYDRKIFSATRYYRDWRARVEGGDGVAMDTLSPAKRAADLKIPLLLAHGDADDTVPLVQSKRLAEALIRLGRPPEYYVYKGEGHGFAKPENQVDFLKKVEAFLAKWNPS